jgi:aminoglycoside phosphotransferase (APT) family kinase protein
MEWLAEHIPPDTGPALVHNDYKYDNLVLDPADPTRILAVLDWEMATLGDPLMDLGTTLGYWVEADDPEPLRAFALGPTALPGSLTRAELAQRYAERTGADLSNLLVYYVYGLFKIAVIVQQIHARYRAGKTRDPRFAGLSEVVGLYGAVAAAAIETDRLG